MPNNAWGTLCQKIPPRFSGFVKHFFLAQRICRLRGRKRRKKAEGDSFRCTQNSNKSSDNANDTVDGRNPAPLEMYNTL